jgi:hypothetical protein
MKPELVQLATSSEGILAAAAHYDQELQRFAQSKRQLPCCCTLDDAPQEYLQIVKCCASSGMNIAKQTQVTNPDSL